MESLVDMCEAVLIEEASESSRSIGNLHFLFVAEKFGLKKLYELCVKQAKDTQISKLIEQKHYKEINIYEDHPTYRLIHQVRILHNTSIISDVTLSKQGRCSM